MRLGALPDTDVNIPQPPVKSKQPEPAPVWVLRLSQNGAIACAKLPLGRQLFEPPTTLDINCKLPLEETLALLKILS